MGIYNPLKNWVIETKSLYLNDINHDSSSMILEDITADLSLDEMLSSVM